MAAGIPIVTTKTQGPLEILDKKIAYFTEAANAKQMAKDICLALRSNQRYKFAKLSKKRFDTLYTSEKVTGQYLNLYQDLLRK